MSGFSDLALKALDFCLSELFQTTCLACARRSSRPLCEECYWFPWVEQEFVGTISALWYREPWRSVIHAIKFQNRSRLLHLFDPVWSEVEDFSLPGTVVTPVPIHFSTLRKRGFNPAEFLAHRLAGRLGLPVQYLLWKVRRTAPQSLLEGLAREGNLKGAFRYAGSKPPPERVLLVDDILTTGETVLRCTEALRQAGVSRVRVWTLFRA